MEETCESNHVDPPAANAAGDPSALFFAAPLLLAAVAAVVGLLGFGERGALEKFAELADE